jgi:predicted outer membrane protein
MLIVNPQHAISLQAHLVLESHPFFRLILHWKRLKLAANLSLAYNSPMAKKSPEPFEVTCPCCSATLKVDPDTRAVISHTAPVKPKTFADFEAAAKAMREQEGRKESLFRQAVDAEKNKADLLEKKFQEAVKKAKETPDEPHRIRDFDLD